MADGPLHGIRVLEFSQIVAAPFSGIVLSDLGADVVKVEPPGGDPHRNAGAVVPMHGKRFQSLNRGKRGIVVDLRKPEGRTVIHRILPFFDVLTINYRPGVARKMGIDYETLRAIHPGLIYCEASGFDFRGPLAEQAAADIIAQAYSGLMAGDEKVDEYGTPQQITPSLADLSTGFSMVIGICAALYHRHRARTGQGQLVRASLLRSALVLQETAVMREPVTDSVSRDPMLEEVAAAWARGADYREVLGLRRGHRLITAFFRCYYGSFQTKDKPVVLGAVSPLTRARARKVLGITDDPSDEPGFDARSPEAAALATSLLDRIQTVLRTKGSAEWVAAFVDAGVPVAPVNLPEEMADDPHVRAAGLMAELEHEVTGPQWVAGPVVEMSESPTKPNRAAPSLGAHTDEVLAAAGFAADEIADLRAKGVLGQAD